MITYLNLNGIATDVPKPDEFWMAESFTSFVLKENDHTHDTEELAFHLRNLVAERVFGSLQAYYDVLPFTPIWLSQAGIDSDIKISKDIIGNRIGGLRCGGYRYVFLGRGEDVAVGLRYYKSSKKTGGFSFTALCRGVQPDRH